jgi:ankyrin repeat protein
MTSINSIPKLLWEIKDHCNDSHADVTSTNVTSTNVTSTDVVCETKKLIEICKGIENILATRDTYGHSLLHYCGCLGNVCFAEYLLSLAVKAGILDDILELKDSDGYTALYYACSMNHPNLAKFLISHGAYTKVKNNQGVSILERVLQLGNVEIIKILTDKLEVDPADLVDPEVPTDE